MAKQQRTKWTAAFKAADGTFIRSGVIYNKRKKPRMDIVRLQIKSKSGYWDLRMSVDEAAEMTCGLSSAIRWIAIPDGSKLARKLGRRLLRKK